MKQKYISKPKRPTEKQPEGHQPEMPTERPQGQAPEKAEIEPIQDLNGLPNRDLFRLSEVADYLQVSVSTIRLWKDHGYFQVEKMRGTVWITKASILKFRLKNRIQP